MPDYSDEEIRHLLKKFNASPGGQVLDFSATQLGDTDLQFLLREPPDGSPKSDSGNAIVRQNAIDAINVPDLNLWSFPLTDAALVHFKALSCLQTLSLRNTLVTDAGLTHLQDLRELSILSLRNTPITDTGLIRLHALKDNLKMLSLRETCITEAGIEHLQALTSLRVLDLSYTQISDASKLVSLLEVLLPSSAHTPAGKGHLKTLYLRGNKRLGLDDRQLDETDATTLYRALLSLRDAGRRPLHEIKVVIVGDGEVGKSNLLDRLSLRQPPPKRDRTHDFEVEELVWNVPRPEGEVAVRFRIYDFGGQPSLHGAHRFFLSGSRNIYLLVNRCGGVKPRESTINYWTGLIAFHGRGAAGLVVQSWCDHPVSDEWGSVTESMLGKRNPRFPFSVVVVQNYYDGKSPQAEGIKELLIKIAAETDYVFRTTYEPGFFALKSWLEQDRLILSDGPQFVRYCSVEDFRANCNAVGITDGARQDMLLQIFGDLGRVLYVGDLPTVKNSTGHALRHWIMNPQWAKKPVYQVIRDMPLAATHGRAKSADILFRISQRCPGISETEAVHTIALMEACGLIFPLKGVNNTIEGYLVVDQLPTSDAGVAVSEAYESWGQEEVFECDFVGEHLLPRFIGLWHHRLLSLTALTFRDRAVFTDSSDQRVHALVKADVVNSRIAIRTRGGAKTESQQSRLRDEIARRIRELMAEEDALMAEGGKKLEASRSSLPSKQMACVMAFRWAEESVNNFDSLSWEKIFAALHEAELPFKVDLPTSHETFERHCNKAGIRLRRP